MSLHLCIILLGNVQPHPPTNCRSITNYWHSSNSSNFDVICWNDELLSFPLSILVNYDHFRRHILLMNDLSKKHSSNFDVIWHLCPICKGQNDRKMTIFISGVLRKLNLFDQAHNFYPMVLISTKVLHGNALFYLEPSDVYFLRI